MFEMRNAKFDSTYKGIQENTDFTGSWKKIKEKKLYYGLILMKYTAIQFLMHALLIYTLRPFLIISESIQIWL